VEKTVNITLALGLIILLLGIMLWFFSFSQRSRLSSEAMLVIFGLILLLFGVIAAKVFSKVGN